MVCAEEAWRRASAVSNGKPTTTPRLTSTRPGRSLLTGRGWRNASSSTSPSNAAMLAREYIFSDAGQMNLARGHARPIRIARLTLPPELKDRLVPEGQYAKARALKPAVWTEEVKKLPRAWQREVLGAAR